MDESCLKSCGAMMAPPWRHAKQAAGAAKSRCRNRASRGLKDIAGPGSRVQPQQHTKRRRRALSRFPACPQYAADLSLLQRQLLCLCA